MANFDLHGKRILVTGAAQGIGRAVALESIAAGASVVLVDRTPIDIADFPDGAKGRITLRVLDLSDVSAFDALAADIESDLGGLDAIVHVAAVIVRRASIDEVTEDDFDLQYSVNLKSTFFLVTRLRRIVADGGAIVLFSSQGWWTGGLGGSLPYAATKAGVVALVRGLSRELAPQGIRINAVAPGFVDTDMMRIGVSDEQRNKLIGDVPLGRFATPQEVAETALFLVSEHARYMTGATLNVTGGQLIY